MARIPFKIEYRPQIESGEYKVVTDCGEPVEIVKWDCKGECPILAVIDDGDTSDSCFFKENGSSLNEKDWIYIITDDIKLTEFGRSIASLISQIDSDWAVFMSTGVYERYIIDFAPIIMEAAKKEILNDMPKWHKNIAEWDSTTEHLYKGYYIDLEEVFDKLPKEE